MQRSNGSKNRKENEVCKKFYRLVAMMSRTWTGSNYRLYFVAGNTQPSSQNIKDKTTTSQATNVCAVCGANDAVGITKNHAR
jgi:hypothetical protein